VSLTDFIIVDRLFLEALDDDAEDALVSSVLSGAFAYFGYVDARKKRPEPYHFILFRELMIFDIISPQN
jgi:hypothetical protein